MTKFDREPNKLVDDYGIEWTEKFSVWSANVGGLISVQVAWENGEWFVQIAH